MKISKHTVTVILIAAANSVSSQTSFEGYANSIKNSTQIFTPLSSDQSGLPAVVSGHAIKSILSFKDSSTKRGPAEASIYQKVSAGTVLISTSDGLGSGALITKSGYILTNEHVVGNSSKVRVFFRPISSSNDLSKAIEAIGTVTKINAFNDLALIKVDSIPSHARPIPIKTDIAPAIGEDAHAVGHPRGEVWSYTKGYVSQVRSNYEWKGGDDEHVRSATVIQTQTPINPGNSGGPLVNSNGELIGINSFGDPNSPGLNFAVATSTIETFLKQEGSRLASKQVKSKSCGDKPIGEKETTVGGGPATIFYYDPECKGRSTAAKIIPLDKSQPIALIFNDPKSTDKSVLMLLDNNRDNQYDVTFYDVDGDGTWDLQGVNLKGELVASNLKPISKG